MAIPKICLCNPTHQPKPKPSTFFQPKQIPDLKGKSVIILDNAWWIWEQTLPTLTEALTKRYGVAKTTVHKTERGLTAPGELEKLAKEGDCAIVSLAMGGPEIGGVIDNALVLAKAGLPTVCIVVEQDPNYLIWDKMLRARRVNLPAVTIPLEPENLPVEKAIEMMEAIIDDIVSALKNRPKPQAEEVMEPFIEVPDSLDEIHSFMYWQEWTDGLPVIPPTEERVHKMLSQVHGDADEIIGEMPPFQGVATVGNITANAVMAGCLPEYMPVLMALVRACGKIGWMIAAGYTGGVAITPMAIVNGPIRNELDINCQRGLMGPGRRSNASLGRALQFMLRNIGGATVRVSMHAYMGHPGGYTFCFGENEEGNPWEPLHVERGFSPETSTVTVANATSFIPTATYTYDWKTVLTVLANSVAYFGNFAMLHGSGPMWAFITPEHARRCAEAGLSKRDVKEFIWEKARFPKSQFPEKLVTYPHKLSETNGQVQVMKSPDDINVVVVARPDVYYALTVVGDAGATVAII